MGIPPAQLKRSVSSSDFVRLVRALQRRRNARTTDHHYFAEMLLRLELIRHPKSTKRKTTDYLLEFDRSKKEEKQKTPQQRLADSKAFWSAIIRNPRKKK